MFPVILPLLLQPPPQTGLVIQHDFISKRVRRQQIHFFQSLRFFVLYLRTRRLVVRQLKWMNLGIYATTKLVSATPERQVLDHW